MHDPADVESGGRLMEASVGDITWALPTPQPAR
jgi:hypothetical protein